MCYVVCYVGRPSESLVDVCYDVCYVVCYVGGFDGQTDHGGGRYLVRCTGQADQVHHPHGTARRAWLSQGDT